MDQEKLVSGKGVPEMCAPVDRSMKKIENCFGELSIMSNIGLCPLRNVAQIYVEIFERHGGMKMNMFSMIP